jgi:hypothetical protein
MRTNRGGAYPEKPNETALHVPIILQAVESHKVNSLLKALGANNMRIELIGKDDFRIVGPAS